MFTALVNNLTTLLLLLATGFVIRRLHILDDRMNAGLSELMLKVALPATIIYSMQTHFTRELFMQGGFVMIAVFFISALGMILGYLVPIWLKQPYESRGIWMFAIAFGNLSYMGIPIIAAIFGDEALFFVSMGTVGYNLLAPTLGAHFMKHYAHYGKKEVKFKVSPAFAATLIGLFFFVFSIQLPYPVISALTLMGHTTTPLSMVLIGSFLAHQDFGVLFRQRRLYIAVLFRNVLIPLLVFVLLSPFVQSTEIFAIVVYLSSMPSAATTTMYANIYDADATTASALVFMTTVFSLVTIPLLSLILPH